jgi:DNA-binding transcriptional regulator LsrR (DeoR family)
MPRPLKVATTAEMLLAAQLFYKEKLPKKAIAPRLHTDIRGVSWLLDEAEKKGLVRIQIHQTVESDLEHRLKTRFPHLDRVLIIPGPPVTASHYPAFLKQAGAVTAVYFDDLVDYHKRGPLHIGITGGETLLEFVNAVPDRERKALHIHPTALVGRTRLHKAASHINPEINATILWSRSGRVPGRAEYVTVPPYEIQKPGREARLLVANRLVELAQSKLVSSVIRPADLIDVAFAGLGIVNPGANDPVPKITMTGIVQSIVPAKTLADEGAIGDISYCLFDAEGNGRKEWEFFITAGHYEKDPKLRGIGFFKRLVAEGKKVVVIAGPYKLGTIKVALKAKMFNVWITDEATAHQIAAAD